MFQILHHFARKTYIVTGLPLAFEALRSSKKKGSLSWPRACGELHLPSCHLPPKPGRGGDAVAGIGKKCGKMRKKCGKCGKKCGKKCGFVKMV